MKQLHLLSLFFVLCFHAHAQSWQWAHDTETVIEAGAAQNIATDNFGSVYCAGDNSLFRHDANTGQIKWFKPIGTLYNINAIATDDAGYLYHYARAAGGYEIKKIDSLGNVLLTISGNNLTPGIISTWRISFDRLGQFYISGYFTSSAIVAGTDTIYNTPTLNNSFVVKYDTSGKVIWGKTISSPKVCAAYGVVGDSHNDFYIAGEVDTSVLTIGDTTVVLPYTGQNIFVAKCDATGRLLWITSNKHTHGFFYTDRKDLQIGIDAYSNVYIAGMFKEPDTLGATPLPYTASCATNVFVAKYESSTGSVLWAKVGYSSVVPRIYSFAVNKYGDSYYLFSSGMTTNFDGSIFTGTSLVVPTSTIGLDNSGNVVTGFVLAGRTGDDECGVGIDNSGNGYVCGDYIDSCHFGSYTLHTAVAGGEQYFVAKFLSLFPIGQTTGILSEGLNSCISFYPNPATNEFTLSYNGPLYNNANVAIYDMTGRIRYIYALKENSTILSVADLPQGIYLCRIDVDGNNMVTKKLVVMR